MHFGFRFAVLHSVFYFFRLVRFQHSMVFAVQGETQSFFWSTDPKLNDLNSGDLAVPDVR